MSRAFVNDLANQLTEASANPVFAITADFTLFAWYKRTVITGDRETLLRKSAGGSEGYMLGVESSNQLRGLLSGPQNIYSTTVLGTVGVWYACGFKRTSAEASVWVNGSKEGITASPVAPVPASGDVLRIGSGSTFDPTYGELADCAVWNVALSDKEMVALSQGVSPMMIRLGSLVGYWPLLGVSSSPEGCLSGSGRNMVLTGASAITTPNHPMGRWKTHAG